MKKRNKVLALLLTGAMLAGSLVGCGNQTENKETQVSTTTETNKTSETVATTPSEPEKAAVTYPVDTDVELDVYIGHFAALNGEYASYEDSYWHSKISDKIGIKTNLAPRIVDAAAQDLYVTDEKNGPDIFQVTVYTFPEYAASGNILDLTDYIPEYMPNFWKYINSPGMENMRRSLVDDEGRWYAIGGGTESLKYGTYMGPCIRQDWLDECGLDMPVTLADWENVLRTFKDKYGATLSGTYSDFKIGGFASGTNALTNFEATLVVDDGKIVLANDSDEWRNYIETFKRWFDEDLVDQDFFTADRNLVRQKAMEGKTGASMTAASLISNFIDDAKTTGADWVGAPYPRVAAGEPTSVIQWKNGLLGLSACMSVSSNIDEEKIPAALAWMDYWYTEEGLMFSNFGIEGETYTIVDGVPKFTDMVVNDPAGMSQAVTKYAGFNSSMLGYQMDAYFEAKNVLTPQILEATVTWTENTVAGDTVLPQFVLNDEELSKYTDPWNNIKTYVSENIAKYIKGEISINWDTFMKDIEKLGLQDCIDANQSAYDRYMAK